MKNFKLLLIIAAITFAFTSCEDESTIDGHDLTGSSRIVGWANPIVTESYFEDLGTIDKNYPINVLGGSDGSPTTQDIAFNVTVNMAETTATNGEYTLSASSALIPAGNTYGDLPLGINTGNFSPTAPTKLVLDLSTSVDGVVVSSLARQMTINFVGCQSELANYMYEVTTTREDGAVYGPTVETMLMESVNNFMTYSVGSWGSPLNPGHGVRFEDICGSLRVPTQSLADMYSNTVTSLNSPTVDEDGNFQIDYSISFSAGPLNHEGVYTKQ
ncbi:MAG: hypothetical protein V3U80_10870 [Flavobacteriaceae bacterium]